MLRASHILISPPISPDRWRDILQASGVLESSWVDPNAPDKFAAAITSRVRDLVQREPAPRSNSEKVRDAVAVLRRTLPQVIREYENSVEEWARKGYDLDLGGLEAARRLQAALPEPRWLAPSPPMERPDHFDARRLLRLYRKHVDPNSGISADGPPLKVVLAGLRAMGHKPQSSAAIAKALQRKL
jgi:hypothetical protein